jgi:hypothetical protein
VARTKNMRILNRLVSTITLRKTLNSSQQRLLGKKLTRNTKSLCSLFIPRSKTKRRKVLTVKQEDSEQGSIPGILAGERPIQRHDKNDEIE